MKKKQLRDRLLQIDHDLYHLKAWAMFHGFAYPDWDNKEVEEYLTEYKSVWGTSHLEGRSIAVATVPHSKH